MAETQVTHRSELHSHGRFYRVCRLLQVPVTEASVTHTANSPPFVMKAVGAITRGSLKPQGSVFQARIDTLWTTHTYCRQAFPQPAASLL